MSDNENTRMFSTFCGLCVFNESREIKDEVDCKLGRYELFRERGEINEEGIITRLCTGCRDLEWKNRKDENPVCRIEKELENCYSLVIFDTEKGILNRLKDTLSNRQTIDPKQIIVVYTDDTPLGEVTKIVTEYIKGTDIKFHVIKAVFNKEDSEIIDLSVKKCDGLFYILVKNGEKLEENAIELLYKEIEEKLNKVIYIRPYSNLSLTGCAIHLRFHQLVNGNVEKDIFYKLEEAISEETRKDYFKDWGDLT